MHRRMMSFIFTVSVLAGLIQGAILQDLLECYTPIKMAYDLLEADGGSNEDLSPIIFLHGAFAVKENWNDIPQNVSNATGRKVYNLDARNHGDSEWSDCFNFDINALDVLHFMDEHSIEKAILIGHSMGGITAIKVALRAPERAEEVFIEDIYTKLVPQEVFENYASLFEMIDKAVKDIPSDLDYEEAMDHLNEFIDSQEETKESLVNSLTSIGKYKRVLPLKRVEDGHYTLKVNTRVLLDTFRSTEPKMSEHGGQFEGPAHFIYVTESVFKLDEEGEDISKFFPNADILGIEGDHNEIRINFPDELEEWILMILVKEDE